MKNRLSKAYCLGLVVWLFASTAWAGELGRLFSTPRERAALDVARDAYDPYHQEIIVKEGESPEPPAPPKPMPELMVEGLVIRSNGRHATWVNGTEMLSGETTVDGIRVEADKSRRSVRFLIPSGDGTEEVKPGQLLNPNVGSVREQYSLPASNVAPPPS